MGRTRVKICCIASLDEARLAIAAGADALGLVGAMPTGPGVISDAVAAEIAEAAPPGVASFLLTSEQTAAGIAAHVVHAGASTVQIVRHVDREVHRHLAELLPPVIRRVQVIHVEDEGALEWIDVYAPFVHAFLLDSGRPSQAELGGTGRTHDWEVSRRFVERSPHPVFLAGGLTADNVRAAIRQVRPFGVDLCSGVRTGGALDPDKLHAFLREVRGALPPADDLVTQGA